MSAYSKFATVTMDDRRTTHERLAAEKRVALDARREIGAAYLEQHPTDIVVPFERAVTHFDLADASAPARHEAIALNGGRSTDINNVALEFPVLGHEFAADGPVLRLATDPVLMAPIVRYFDMMPILFNVFVTRAHQTELVKNSPHLFHLDPEDVISLKVFVHLTDVDDGCGPFHALPADLTTKVLDELGYKGVDRFEDDQVAALVGWDSVVRVTGPAGTVALADTTRCLHFGGRPRDPGKPLREMVIFQYLLPTSILLNGEHATSARKFLPQLDPTGDDAWDALIGARFV